MTDHVALVERYLAGWNETDPSRRRAILADTWADGASYVDPVMNAEGVSGIDALIAAAQQRFPGFRFRRIGEVESHNGRLRFRWGLGPDGADAPIKGTDFAVLADGRMASVTGFFDQLPAQ
ncbi:MAG TPA: nuclear transport factor 2 family protein [Hyphomicrobiales bacterium]|nr:nuclear transport factor 2 family protein [Hyphomicrobiales bacterium]